MRTHHLQLPVMREQINALSVGDIVYLNGTIVTLRDRSHRRIEEYAQEKRDLPFNLRDCAALHCGPVIKTLSAGGWEAIDIGATSSSRFSPFIPPLIHQYGINLIVGKGNLFKGAVDALKSTGAAFLLAIGGCAALYGSQVKKVVANYWPEFGMADSVWEFEMQDFGPLCVGIDNKGGNMYRNLREVWLKESLPAVYAELGIDPETDYTWWPQVPPGTRRATEYSIKL
jgi:tartrate/fumarate subfamily iron-sulfur-dependent hydro-lyase beta chain